MVNNLINNWQKYCGEDCFVGIGSTRKVYKVSDYVIKVNLHPIGYEQSTQELNIYRHMRQENAQELFAEVYYVDKQIAIQKYYEPIELKDNQSFEIDPKHHQELLPERYNEILFVLDQTFDSFDIKDSSNYGLNDEGKLVLIDFGMTKQLYNEQWVPLAETGILPQIDVDFCSECKEKMELRMYGNHDVDKRCYACGKE